jgi:hypothetical protein
MQTETKVLSKVEKRNRYFLYFMGTSALVAAIYGWYAYFNGMSVYSVISFPFIWEGLFVWGDAMILGTFIFGASLFLLKKNDYVLTGLFFSIYYMIRSLIEAIYNLNAQFSPISRPWEGFVPDMAARFNFKPQELFVVPQITYTAVFITAAMVFLVFLKKYLKD